MNLVRSLHSFKRSLRIIPPSAMPVLMRFLMKNILKRLEFKLDVNTTSSYILWNDKGKFRWEKLPTVLQVSPIKKMIVQDFNGDNYPDVLLARQ